MGENSPTILIMAGERHGQVDPLAAQYGVEHKCLVPLLGRPLIAWVLDAVDAAFPDSRIVVSIDNPRALENEPEALRYSEAGRLTAVASATNLMASVVRVQIQVQWPQSVPHCRRPIARHQDRRSDRSGPPPHSSKRTPSP